MIHLYEAIVVHNYNLHNPIQTRYVKVPCVHAIFRHRKHKDVIARKYFELSYLVPFVALHYHS